MRQEVAKMRLEVKFAHETRILEHAIRCLVIPDVDDPERVVDIALERQGDGYYGIVLSGLYLPDAPMVCNPTALEKELGRD
jgi:hypothetical protein